MAIDNDLNRPPLVTCSPPPEAEFRYGKTLVNCTTKDNAGLVDECQFTVNVKGE